MKKLTIGEIAKIEELSGLSATMWEDDESPKALQMAATAFVLLKRDDPKVKWSDVLEMDLEEVAEIVTKMQEEMESASKSS